jgi:ribosomal protein S18 acetylase RimI-like enzyme
MDIKIQPFSEKHTEGVVALMNDFRDFLISIDPNGRFRRLPGYGEYALKEELANTTNDRGVLLVALDGDKTIGFSVAFLLKKSREEDSLGTTPSQSGRIEELYITPEYRKKGIASLLMQNMEIFLKEHGCDYILVGVKAYNQNAHELYQHLGYKDVGIDLIKKIK